MHLLFWCWNCCLGSCCCPVAGAPSVPLRSVSAGGWPCHVQRRRHPHYLGGTLEAAGSAAARFVQPLFCSGDLTAVVKVTILGFVWTPAAQAVALLSTTLAVVIVPKQHGWLLLLMLSLADGPSTGTSQAAGKGSTCKVRARANAGWAHDTCVMSYSTAFSSRKHKLHQLTHNPAGSSLAALGSCNTARVPAPSVRYCQTLSTA